jgi:hypothetical protein
MHLCYVVSGVEKHADRVNILEGLVFKICEYTKSYTLIFTVVPSILIQSSLSLIPNSALHTHTHSHSPIRT